jgi:hypothetical protein
LRVAFQFIAGTRDVFVDAVFNLVSVPSPFHLAGFRRDDCHGYARAYAGSPPEGNLPAAPRVAGLFR